MPVRDAIDTSPVPFQRRRRASNVARPPRHPRPVNVSTAFVVLTSWALFHGAAEALERRRRWSHPFGNMQVTCDDCEFTIWLPGAIVVARISATQENWRFGERETFLATLQHELREGEAARAAAEVEG